MKYLKINLLLLLFFCIQTFLFAQENEKYKDAALEIINQSDFCALVTIDNNGYPVARMMQTLPVEDDFIIWLGTNPITQKVEQIKNNPNVSVYYTESNSTGYANLQGKAKIINDRESKDKYWKEGWESYYPDKEKDFVLIKITPIKLQIVSYANGIVSTEENWKATEIKFTND